MLRRIIFACSLLCGLATSALVASAEDQKVIVTVNDKPITSFDIQQRINLWKLLGDRRKQEGIRKRALNEMIDDLAAIEETKKSRAEPSEKDVDAFMLDYAKGLKTDENGLKQKLKAQGISTAAMRQYLAGRIAFNRIVRGRDKQDFGVSDAEVKRCVAKYRSQIDNEIAGKIRAIENDPRRRAITVYQLMPITFPTNVPKSEVTQELINSRAIEANQFISRFKGCGSARAAASGIFNVQIGKKVEADGSKIDKRLKEALTRAGQGRAVGPIPTATGVEAIAFCGIRKITPPKIERPKNIQYPSEAQCKNVLTQEKFDQVAAKYSGKFRKGLFIEFRDPAYSQ